MAVLKGAAHIAHSGAPVDGDNFNPPHRPVCEGPQKDVPLLGMLDQIGGHLGHNHRTGTHLRLVESGSPCQRSDLPANIRHLARFPDRNLNLFIHMMPNHDKVLTSNG